MISGEFSQKEKAVLLSIIEQSKRYPDEPFAYDVKEGQLFFNDMGIAIDRIEHLEIIRNLTSNGVIDADWLIPPEETLCNPELTICSFANNREWAQKQFASNLLVPYTEKYDDYCFVNIHPSEARTIKSAMTPACTANIAPATDPLALTIHCSSKKIDEDYIIHTLKDGGRPYKIISYALHYPNKTITREELDQNLSIGQDANIAKIFERNQTIKEVLSPLITLRASFIRINQNVELTWSQYKAIKAKANGN